jgi:hypothetical protein
MQTNKVSPDSLRSPETSASQPRRNNVKATTNWNDVRSKELLRAEINRKKIYRDFIEKANIFNQAGEILRYSIARLESGWCRQLSHRQLTQERKRSETLSFLSLQWCALLTGIGFAIAVIDCEFEYQSSLLYCSDTDTYVRPTIAARDGLQCDKRVEFRARYENWQVYIRILNSACTLFLLIMLFVYHNCAIRVDYIRDPAFVTNPAMETPSAFMLLLKPSFLLEWCACAFHTAPFVTFSITTQDVGNTPITYSYQMISVLWMGARFYVIVRYIKESMLALQRAPCIEILAGLAKIKLDGRFASKMWFNHNSMIRLLGMLLVLLVYSAYCSNVCDRPIVDSQQLQFADSLWMIFITMTTVGFGDIVPKTHCSRFMAGCAMVGGLGVTSILVMYITNQILFSGEAGRYTTSCLIFILQQNLKRPFTISSLLTNYETICIPKLLSLFKLCLLILEM